MAAGDFEERFWARVDRRGPDDCWPWTGALNSDGYGVLRLDGGFTTAHRHALVLDGRDPGPLEALHSCDRPDCANPAHLRPGTHAENMADAALRGRSPAGERNGIAKLTRAKVRKIRRRIARGDRQADIAADFEVGQTTISRIATGAGWREAA